MVVASLVAFRRFVTRLFLEHVLTRDQFLQLVGHHLATRQASKYQFLDISSKLQ